MVWVVIIVQDGTDTRQSCLGVLTVTDHELARLTIIIIGRA